jgi:hypothetical protein
MNILEPATSCAVSRSRGLWTGAAAVLTAALALSPLSAFAGAILSGTPQNVKIDAQNSSIEEILVMLGHHFNMHYSSSANLANQITGTYEGSIQHVVTRLLQGHNFIVKSSVGRIEVTVLGTDKEPKTGGAQIDAKAAPSAQPKPANPASGPGQLAQRPNSASGEPTAAPPAPAVAPPTTAAEMKVAEGPVPVLTPVTPGSSIQPPMPNTTNLVAPPATAGAATFTGCGGGAAVVVGVGDRRDGEKIGRSRVACSD